jgi:NAD(P)-dependent dehydrogenase (short-subunit alcohol dehydrogenase family)
MMCTRVAVEDMLKRSVPGRIIFISSTRGIRAYPEDNIYGSLKAALIRSVQSLALELAKHNITVNCIAPGATKVRGDISPEGLQKGYLPGKIPLKRYGTPEEIGHLLAFIASDEAGYITGETIRIDGGLILPGMKEKE